MTTTPSTTDGELLLEFLAFMNKHKHLLEGYNTRVPVEGFVLVACVALLTFDYLCTFDLEVNYVWSCPWSFGLPLFYFNRYLPMVNMSLFVYMTVSHHSVKECSTIVNLAIWLTSASSFCSSLIIVLRTCALWQNHIAIVSALLFLLAGTFAVNSIFTAQQIATMEYAPTPSYLTGCLVADGTKLSLYIYVTIFASEGVIIGLTVVKAAQHLRRSQTPWLAQLYKNGIFYCLCILMLSLTNIGVHLSKLPYIYKQATRLPQHILQSVFCSRVMMQILQYRHFHALRRVGHRATATEDVPSQEDDLAVDALGTRNIFTTVVLDTLTDSVHSRSSDVAASPVQEAFPRHRNNPAPAPTRYGTEWIA